MYAKRAGGDGAELHGQVVLVGDALRPVQLEVPDQLAYGDARACVVVALVNGAHNHKLDERPAQVGVIQRRQQLGRVQRCRWRRQGGR